MAKWLQKSPACMQRRAFWIASLACCFVVALFVVASGSSQPNAGQIGSDEPALIETQEANGSSEHDDSQVARAGSTSRAKRATATQNTSGSTQAVAASNDDKLNAHNDESPAIPTASDNTDNNTNDVVIDLPTEPTLFTLPAGADYVPDVVLVCVNAGMDTQTLATLLAEEGVKTVDPNSIVWVTDDLVQINVAQGSSVEDAVNELLAVRFVQGAQPNYLYDLADDAVLLEDDDPLPTSSDKDSPSDLDSGLDEEAQISELDAQDPVIEESPAENPDESTIAELDDVTTQANETQPVNDPYYPWQWALKSMNVPEAWKLLKNSPSSISTVGVAVLDSGFDVNHEDLKNVIAEGSPYNAYRASIGIKNSEDLADVKSGPTSYDHGSHVAGIIAAEANNGTGIVGVANNARIIPIRCYSYETDQATSSSLRKGIDYAIENQTRYNIRVLNLSVGMRTASLSNDDLLLKKIDAAFSHGIITIAAAGNLTSTAIPFINWPSDHTTCVSVINLMNNTLSTTYSEGTSNLLEVLFSDAWSVIRSPKSNYNAAGETTKDISAPGTDILSSIDNTTTIQGKAVPYGLNSGTSMAAPQVTGVLALMHGAAEVTKDANGAQYMVDALYNSARTIGNGNATFNEETGYGEVDALAALKAVASDYLEGPSYVKVGQKEKIEYSVMNQDNKLTGWSYSSTSPDVMSIDATTGICTPVSAGTANIRATNGAKSLVKSVVVIGGIKGYDVVTTQGTASYEVHQPTNLKWEWTSSDGKVASISKAGILTTGDTAGWVTLTATLVVTKESSNAVSIEKKVAVVGPLIGNPNIKADETTTLSIEGPTGWKFVPEDFVWSSEDESIATVDGHGVVTGVCGGTTTIWAYPREACTTYIGDDGLEHTSSSLHLDFSLIVSDNINSSKVQVTNLNTQTYTGKELKPIPTLLVGDRVLQRGVDYKLSYANNVHVGTATMTIKGIGTFTGSSRTEHFKILRASISGAVVASIKNMAYTGKNISPKPEVTWKKSVLTLNSDYTLSYKNNVNAGKATIVVTGKGDFKGTKKATFLIVAPSVAYRSYVHGKGWRSWCKDGAKNGLKSKGAYIEGFAVKLSNTPYTGGIQYEAYVQGVGWQGLKSDGSTAGAKGKSKRVEAIRISLTGKMAKHYSVSYRTNVQGTGWTPWTNDGKTSGTTGKSLCLYQLQVKLVPK